MLAFRGFVREQLWKALPRPSLRELLRALGPISASTSRLCSSASLSAINNRARWTETEGSTGWLYSICGQHSAQNYFVKPWRPQFRRSEQVHGAEIYLVLKQFVFNLFLSRGGLLSIHELFKLHVQTHVLLSFHTATLTHTCAVQAQSTVDQRVRLPVQVYSACLETSFLTTRTLQDADRTIYDTASRSASMLSACIKGSKYIISPSSFGNMCTTLQMSCRRLLF